MKRTDKQMPSQTIKLHSKKQVNYAANLMNETLGYDDLWCVEIKKYKEAKTMQQLRGLFGTWYDYLSDTLGETKDDLHLQHKCGNYVSDRFLNSGWLVDIYTENPEGKMQKMWVELFNQKAINFNQFVKSKAMPHSVVSEYIDYLNHVGRISLSWATIDQMREYMTRIEHYYMTAGYPLPILEKFQRAYRR